MTPDITLREVRIADLPTFYAHQRDKEALRMADFPSRDWQPFDDHWRKNMAEPSNVMRTILYQGRVAGNLVCWQAGEERDIGYWLGREFWGKGIASKALAEFLTIVKERPLHAHVAKHNIGSIRVLERCGFLRIGEAEVKLSDGAEASEEFVYMLA
jgi:RimJ/RimL family protein N-acetyltransferase